MPSPGEGSEQSDHEEHTGARERVLSGATRRVALALLLVVATGVAAAALLRPLIGSPSADTQRASGRGDRSADVVSLANVEPRRGGVAATDQAGPRGVARPVTVIGVGTGEFQGGSVGPAVTDPDGPPDADDARIPSDEEIKRQIAEFRAHLEGIDPRIGDRAYIDKHGRLILPRGAPRVVAQVVAAANEIATKPYKWGGGHGAWRDSGYDCSGSVSFALAGARLLDRPLDSTAFMRYGAPGKGRWMTIYANPGHMFMTVAGFRFDTSGQSAAGTRWQRGTRSTAGFTVRHPPRT
jgi:hypothetical protein